VCAAATGIERDVSGRRVDSAARYANSYRFFAGAFAAVFAGAFAAVFATGLAAGFFATGIYLLLR
jgi:hypothetical protein